MKKRFILLLAAGCLLLTSCKGGDGGSSNPPASSAPALSSEAPASSAPPPSSQGPVSLLDRDGVKTELLQEETERLTEMFNLFWIAQKDVAEDEPVPVEVAYTPFLLVRDEENTVRPEVFEAALRDFWGRDVPLFTGAAPTGSLIPLSLEDGVYTLPAMGLSEWHETVIEAAYSLGDGVYRLVGTTRYKSLGADGLSEMTVALSTFEAAVRQTEESRFGYQVLAQRYTPRS